eukprot:11702914-Karenia_brevis.AAC.1
MVALVWTCCHEPLPKWNHRTVKMIALVSTGQLDKWNRHAAKMIALGAASCRVCAVCEPLSLSLPLTTRAPLLSPECQCGAELH